MAFDHAPARHLTPREATSIVCRARGLMRRGVLTHREYCLIDTLLWSCRDPRTGAIVVSYTALQRLAHMARETVARGLRTLEQVGLLSRIKRRMRIAWHQGGARVRQMANAYRLHPTPAAFDHCEFGGATVNKDSTIDVLLTTGFCGEAAAATAALAAIAERRRPAVEARLLGKGRLTR